MKFIVILFTFNFLVNWLDSKTVARSLPTTSSPLRRLVHLHEQLLNENSRLRKELHPGDRDKYTPTSLQRFSRRLNGDLRHISDRDKRISAVPDIGILEPRFLLEDDDISKEATKAVQSPGTAEPVELFHQKADEVSEGNISTEKSVTQHSAGDTESLKGMSIIPRILAPLEEAFHMKPDETTPIIKSVTNLVDIAARTGPIESIRKEFDHVFKDTAKRLKNDLAAIKRIASGELLQEKPGDDSQPTRKMIEKPIVQLESAPSEIAHERADEDSKPMRKMIEEPMIEQRSGPTDSLHTDNDEGSTLIRKIIEKPIETLLKGASELSHTITDDDSHITAPTELSHAATNDNSRPMRKMMERPILQMRSAPSELLHADTNDNSRPMRKMIERPILQMRSAPSELLHTKANDNSRPMRKMIERPILQMRSAPSETKDNPRPMRKMLERPILQMRSAPSELSHTGNVDNSKSKRKGIDRPLLQIPTAIAELLHTNNDDNSKPMKKRIEKPIVSQKSAPSELSHTNAGKAKPMRNKEEPIIATRSALPDNNLKSKRKSLHPDEDDGSHDYNYDDDDDDEDYENKAQQAAPQDLHHKKQSNYPSKVAMRRTNHEKEPHNKQKSSPDQPFYNENAYNGRRIVESTDDSNKVSRKIIPLRFKFRAGLAPNAAPKRCSMNSYRSSLKSSLSGLFGGLFKPKRKSNCRSCRSSLIGLRSLGFGNSASAEDENTRKSFFPYGSPKKRGCSNFSFKLND